MRFADIVTRVNSVTQQESKNNDLIKDSIRWSQDEILGAYDWSFMLTQGYIFTIAPYTTGTVTVTNGSTALTGASTTFTRNMIGRKFRLSDSAPMYVIVGYTSATVLTLNKVYDGTTAATQTYSIFKDEYALPGDMDTSKLFRGQSNLISLLDIDPSDFDMLLPYSAVKAAPRVSMHIGKSIVPLTSVVGTVSITAGQSSLTGTSTTWLTVPEGLGRGSKVRLGSYLYTVKSVDSDTAITIYESALATVSGSSDWSFTLDNTLIQFWPIPDSNYEIPFRYYRSGQPLIQDYDTPDVPDPWHWLLVVGASRRMFMYTGEIQRFQMAEQEFVRGLEQMKQQVGRPTQDRYYRLKSIDSRFAYPGVRFPLQFPRDASW